MPCPSCAAETPPSAKFCPDCGTPLASRCPSCGEDHTVGQRFCASCGTPLIDQPVGASAGAPPSAGPPSTTSAPAEPVAAAAGLRNVSVLFCDLVGYTALSDGRDADDVRTLLSGYFDVSREIVDRYGGTVEKFIGDAVMAVWGADGAHEDDAERATRAALELLAAVARYGESADVPGLAARVGVASGQAATVEARHEGIVVGDRVNIASRVQSEAEPGTVLVDAVTREQCAAAFAWEDAGQHILKGKQEPMRLWRAVRALSHADNDSDGLEAAFIGRDRELDLVKDRFHRVVESGHAERVSVTGHAGVGKSRLYREFRAYVVGIASTNYVHVGRCLSYGDGITYWALAEMVRQRFGIAEADPDERIRELVAEKLPELVPDPFARPVVERTVYALLGAGDEPLSRDELFAGWRLLFEQLGRRHPVLLVFEDTQWADSDLLDFIEQITDWSADHPILVLSLARPELLERRPSWNAARRNVTPLVLDRLPTGDMNAILHDLVDLSVEVRDRIVARADGIPLYAVEMVRMLVDRGLVTVDEAGRRRLVGEVEGLDVPASLTALASARIDALAPDERVLVRDLCVFGGGFPRDAVTAMTDLAGGQAEQALDGLIRKGILSLRTDPLSPERGQVSFDQVILRSTALETLSRKERIAQHLRAARHLRTSFPDDGEEVTELIARHYRDAYDLAGDDANLDVAEALDEAGAMFRRAGERARALGASEAALRSYLSARDCVRDPSTIASLTAEAAEAAHLAGAHDLAAELCVDAHRDLLEDGRTHEAAMVALTHSRVLSNTGDMQGALDILENAVDLDPDDHKARARLTAAMPTKLMALGRVAEAMAAAEAALVIAEAHQLEGELAVAAMAKSMVLGDRGRVHEAIAVADMAVELMEAGAAPVQMLAVAQLNRGELLIHDDRPGVRTQEDEVILLARRAGDRPLEQMAIGNRGLIDVLNGRWADVIAACAPVLEDAEPGTLDFRALPLAIVHALRGNGEAADRCARVLTAPEHNDDPQIAGTQVMAYGYLALARGDRQEARRLLVRSACAPHDEPGALRVDAARYAWPRAVELTFELGDAAELAEVMGEVERRPPGHVPPYLRAVHDFTRGRIAARDGDHVSAEPLLRDALERFERFGYSYWHARSRIVLADWLVGQGRNTDAAAELRAAEELLEPIGAALDLERATGVRERLAAAAGSAAV